jgi:hypothetical protein
VNVLIEMGAEHPLGKASIAHLNDVRNSVQQMAEEAGLRDPAEFACTYQLLMKGAIVCAMMGDVKAAERARVVAEMFIVTHET